MIYSKLKTVAAIAVLLSLSVFAQTTSIRVDGNIIKSYITTMSDTTHLGRRALTPGYQKTADWAAGLFKQWGLKPAGENGTYFQNVPVTGARSSFAFTLGVPELTIDGRSFYVKDNDFTVDVTSTPATKVTGEVVFVGYGISAPAKGLDEYPAIVKGKIVLAFKGSPKDAPVVRSMFGPAQPESAPAQTEAWTEESADNYKAKVAYDKGAAAILLCTPPASATFGRGGAAANVAAMPQGGSQARRELEASPFTRPFVYISNIDERVFRWIMARDPQQSAREFTAGIDQMRRDIQGKKVRSKSTSLKAVVKGYDSVAMYGEKFKNNVDRNVLGKIEGVDPVLKNQYVIVGGHMDHLGVTNGVIMNGADDNASGTATAMEVGRLLAVNKVQPKRTVIIGLWCGEELGLLGSNHYVKNPTDGVSMDRVVTYFNMDMVGLGVGIGAPGALNFPDIYEVIKRDQDPEVLKAVEPSTGGPGGSDHSAFVELGIEALALMTSGGIGHPDYHDSGDDSEKIDPAILAKTGQFVLQGVLNLANESKANLLIADRLHIYNAMRLNVTDMISGTEPAGGRGAGAPGGGRGGGGGGWRYIKASNSNELLNLADERAGQLTTQSSQQQPQQPINVAAMIAMAGRGGGGGRYTLAVRNSGIFDGSIPLMTTTAALLNFGRVDVPANDGVWFNFNSGVSDKGREAVKAMESKNITVNLVNPSAKLLGDMLDATTKPFLVTLTGPATIEPGLIGRMNQKNTLLLIECDPENAQSCVEKLQGLKKQFGDTDNLLVSMKAAGKTEETKKALYMSLVKNGWSKEEIYAIAGASTGGGRGGGGGGNLSKLMPARPAVPGS
jgi:hypothetical protein